MGKSGREKGSRGAVVPETKSTGETDTGELRAACGVQLIKTAGTEIQIYADMQRLFFFFLVWNMVRVDA